MSTNRLDIFSSSSGQAQVFSQHLELYSKYKHRSLPYNQYKKFYVLTGIRTPYRQHTMAEAYHYATEADDWHGNFSEYKV